MQLKINQYDSIETGLYQGKWQIKVGRVDQEGKFWPHFQSIKKKDGSQINVPVTLTFDSTGFQDEFLLMCADELGYELVRKATPPEQEDVPF